MHVQHVCKFLSVCQPQLLWSIHYVIDSELGPVHYWR